MGWLLPDPLGPLSSRPRFCSHSLVNLSFGYALLSAALTSDDFSLITLPSWEMGGFSQSVHLWPLLLFLQKVFFQASVPSSLFPMAARAQLPFW